MTNYILAIIIAVILGQVVNHLIRRLPVIIEEKNAYKKLISTLKQDFKFDFKYSVILIILNAGLVYFVNHTYLMWIYMVLVAMLLVALVIDFKMQLIPDTVQVVIAILGIIVTAVDYSNFVYHIAGMIIAALIFLLIAGFSKIVFRKEGMGMGDIKLMAGLGLIFGIKGTPTSFMNFFSQAEVILIITVLAFFMAAIIAVILIITKNTEKSGYMAFGPYIVIATILVILFGTEPFVNAYFYVCTGLANLVTDLILKIK